MITWALRFSPREINKILCEEGLGVLPKHKYLLYLERGGDKMSFMNEAREEAMLTGKYYCDACGGLMEWEDEWEDILVCPACGNSINSDHYGLTDEEYDELYPTKEDVLGYDEDDEDDEYNGETYEEVYGELSDD